MLGETLLRGQAACAAGRAVKAGAAAVVLAAALAGLAGCGPDGAGLEPLGPGAVVLAYGDSLTHGTGASPEESYPSVLAEITGLDVVRSGVPGEVSARGLARLPGVLERHAPDLVILCHGGNDILRRVDPVDTAGNLRAMVRLVRESGAQAVLVGVPGRSLTLSTASLYGEVAESEAVPLEDEIVGELLGDNRYKSDRVHPNAAGYRRMAEAVAELLREHGAI